MQLSLVAFIEPVVQLRPEFFPRTGGDKPADMPATSSYDIELGLWKVALESVHCCRWNDVIVLTNNRENWRLNRAEFNPLTIENELLMSERVLSVKLSNHRFIALARKAHVVIRPEFHS